MDKNVEMAISDIAVIKGVMEKTQKDFSKVSTYFIWIGIINLIMFVMEQMAYYARNVNGYNSSIYAMLINISIFLPLTSYVICYVAFYRKMKNTNNDISTGMIKIWGMSLIASQVLGFLYIWLIPNGNNDKINVLLRCKELVLILPVLFALLMTGILVQKRIITIVTIVYGIVYFVLFIGMKEVRYGMLGGVGTRVSLSSISIRVGMICGMIALGLYLRKGAGTHGDKFNSGSISDEA